MPPNLILMLIAFRIMLVIIVIFGIIRPLKVKSKFSMICNQIRIGMSEEEMVSEFGAPSKTISVNEDIKAVSYTYSEDKGRIRQPANYQILIMIEEGIIRNISM